MVSGGEISALGKGGQEGEGRNVRGKLAGYFVSEKAKGGRERKGMQPTWSQARGGQGHEEGMANLVQQLQNPLRAPTEHRQVCMYFWPTKYVSD